ncbi:MAG: TonB-dependent receptor [Desulfobacterales bacterium]|nr:TonB-dependent receptor [Desulfobacterales bacterium]
MDAPAAVFVITNEDIRRSGATSIPDALRMAPGVQVARINAYSWAITARGFNSNFSNKLLVMIDGRAVYSPLYSGVYWRARDTLLEDIDRIEVIRGPGASLWGANAVNGVINIITKSAGETQGGLIAAGAGTEERGFGGVRYGARVGENAHVRAYAKYSDRDADGDWEGVAANDDWRKFHAGFRADVKPSAKDSLTFQGDVFGVDADMTYRFATTTPPYRSLSRGQGELDGGNLLARWTRSLPNGGDLAIQMYYDRTKMVDPLINEVRDTLDIDIQHGIALGEWHDLLWGLEYRWTRDELGDEERETRYNPSERALELFSVFIQDQMTLVENRLWLMVGARFENGYYTGWETQPTGRLLWKPLDGHTFWAAISRAVRTPSRTEKDGHITINIVPPGTPANPEPWPMVMRMSGSDSFTSETITAYEAGYRFQPSERFFCDLAFFYNDYRDLYTLEPSGPLTTDPGPPPLMTLPVEFRNKGKGRTRGLELAANFLPMDWWRLHLAYTWFRAKMSDNAQDVDGSSPVHQLGLRSSMDLPYNLQLDLWPRHVDELSSLDIDSYFSLDIRLGWRPRENLEFSLVGQNLLRKKKPEFYDRFSPIVSTAVERGVYGKITWRF